MGKAAAMSSSATAASMSASNPACEALHQRALQITPGGMHHDSRLHHPQHLFIQRAHGPHIWDLDGNKFIDLWMGHYDGILGHTPSVAVEAVRQAALDGLHIGLPHPLEVELSEMVCQLVPSAEQVRFCCSGTEAAMYALRMARAFTGRSVVIKMAGGWHGMGSDTMLDARVKSPADAGPDGLGLPPNLHSCMLSAQFNDPDSVLQAMKQAGSNLAAVLTEPLMGVAGMIPPQQDFLHFLKEETHRRNALLIFDEVITGFRLDLGGAQTLYNITPDITTLGKILGGGTPIGAVCGRTDILELSNSHRPPQQRAIVGGGTYSCNPLSLSAGIATLKYLSQHQPYPQLQKNNHHLQKHIQQIFQQAHIPLKISGQGSLGSFHFLKQNHLPILNAQDVYQNTLPQRKQGFCQLMREQGIFLMGSYALSHTHQQQELDAIIAAAAHTAQIMKHEKSA